jgi:hypothetical protein
VFAKKGDLCCSGQGSYNGRAGKPLVPSAIAPLVRCLPTCILVMAQALAKSRHSSFSTLSKPPLGRLIAALAVLDLSIWSYVAIAVNVSPAVQSPSVTVALQVPNS